MEEEKEEEEDGVPEREEEEDEGALKLGRSVRRRRKEKIVPIFLDKPLWARQEGEGRKGPWNKSRAGGREITLAESGGRGVAEEEKRR